MEENYCYYITYTHSYSILNTWRNNTGIQYIITGNKKVYNLDYSYPFKIELVFVVE